MPLVGITTAASHALEVHDLFAYATQVADKDPVANMMGELVCVSVSGSV